MLREKIFITHATPEDNDFTIWIASRLQLLGYDVWIDKIGLVGGEKFWEEIDNIIRNKAAKLLFVYSKNICQKDEHGIMIPGRLKDGIYKEFSLAESISKQYSLNDFIILLNIDRIETNLFIGADRLNQIPFFENWATGFKQLESKLKKDNISKNKNIDENFGDWYENDYLVPNGITSKYELYYSNWWPIKKLPEYFYIFQVSSEKQAQIIYNQRENFPISKISNFLSSFQLQNTFEVLKDDIRTTIKPKNIFKIKVLDVLLGFESLSFPTHKDTENHLKQLLKRVFHLLMKNRGMFWYEMANKKIAYFYTPANLHSWKVKFEYPFRTKKKNKTKNIIGKHKNLGKWHFAISMKPILEPEIAFSLKSHITFTEDGFKVWQNNKGEIDTDKIHSQRRAKGKRFFNEEWRDMLLAFLNGLKQGEKIEILLCDNFVLEMPVMTETFWADFGYFDPKDETRHGLLSTYENDDEFNDIQNDD
jgi:hypothetical protein